MSIEAMKLAREGVEIHSPTSPEYIVCKALLDMIEQAQHQLKPRCFAAFQPNHEIDRKCQWCAVGTECKTGIPAIEQAHKQEALNRKAENARELGLDYEPENTLHWHALNYRTATTQNAQKMFELLEQFVENYLCQPITQAEKQNPVAWLGFNERGECREVFTPAMQKTFPNYPTTDMTPVYTTPPQRQPLTDEQINEIADEFIVNYRIPAGSHYDFAQAIEAAHGIKGEA